MKAFSLGVVLLLLAGAVNGQTTSDDWVEVAREQVDTALLSPMGQRLLEDPSYTWQHAHTEHFAVHYERKTFAVKVARQAEFFYDFIAADLKSTRDRVGPRSHLFIFRDAKDWERFVKEYGVEIEWAFSFVRGMEMYLQQADSASDSGAVLGHEMTHLVFNRFLEGRIPVWLNEGTAEWYGEFAYAAFKGIKKSKRQLFRRIKEVYPVDALVTMSSYPADREALQSFYETSKSLVGYLQLAYPPEKFEPFLSGMAAGAPVEQALAEHYAIPSVDALARGFAAFIR